MLMKYMDATTDFGFKKLFGEEESKPVLKQFLFDLLELPSPIVELTFLPSEQRPPTPQERKGVFDVYCRDESGRRFIVEMQKTRQHYFKDRALFYSTFPIRQQAERGDWDYQLNAVYCVGILNFTFDDDDDEYISYIQLMNRKKYRVFTEKLTFVYVELPKFTLTMDELQTNTDKWIYFIKHAPELESVPQALEAEPFDLAFHLAELAQLNEVDRYYYEGSLKEYRDRYAGEQTAREEGREIGQSERTLEIAQALIAQQIPLETILRVTGLTAAELQPFLSETSNNS